MSGYDIYFGNPSPTLASIDPGFRKLIFYPDVDGGRATSDGRYMLPEGVSALTCQGSCSLARGTQTIVGVESYRNSLANRVSAGVQLFNIASFGASFDYRRVEEETINRTNVFTQVESACCVYKSYIATFAPPPATANFLAAVDFAPVEYDQRAYFEIIHEFGTHFVASADMGGLYGQETAFTFTDFQRLTSSSFEWMTAAEASFLEAISFNAEAGGAKQRNSSEMFRSLSTAQRIYSLGSRPPRSGSAEDWLQKSIENPMPTAVSLRPLSSLFNSRVVGRLIPNLTAKAANMDRAVVDYCTDVLLPGGRVKSCKPPKTTPPGETARVCITSVQGGGGPGGIPFDDDIDVIMTNGLNRGLEVREISFRATKYVDNIQLFLADSQRRYPLGEHGGRLGDPGRFMFSEGQRITSVQIRFQRYIDRISFYADDGTVRSIGGDQGAVAKTINFRHAVSEVVGYIPDKAWLVGFFGKAQRYIDSINFHVAYTCREETETGTTSTRPSETSTAA